MAALKGRAVKVAGGLQGRANGLPEVNRLLTFNLALTFLEVSGGYVKEHAKAFSCLAGSVKRVGGGCSSLVCLGVSQQDTKKSKELGRRGGEGPAGAACGDTWVALGFQFSVQSQYTWELGWQS